MSESVKVTISLPRELLDMVERERGRRESRSEFFRHALENLLQTRREREAEEQYARGYRQQPETEEEVAAAWATSAAALAREPWK